MPKSSDPITPEKIALIKHLLATKQWFQHQIAAMTNVNQGRISEIKNGKYN